VPDANADNISEEIFHGAGPPGRDPVNPRCVDFKCKRFGYSSPE
jgi:hypothetical protein